MLWKRAMSQLHPAAYKLLQITELNTKLQEQQQVFTGRQMEVRCLKEKLSHNKQLLKKTIWKFNTKETLDQPDQEEQELRSSRCDTLEESHVSNSTQLQEVTKLADQEEEKKK